MSPKGGFDEEGAEMIIDATRKFKATPPGRVEIHYDSTGFFRAVFEKEEGVLDGLKEYMKYIPAYHPKFFRVAEPRNQNFHPWRSTASFPLTKRWPIALKKALPG